MTITTATVTTAAAAAATATATTTTTTTTTTSGSDHAVEQIESSQSDGLVLVIKTQKYQVLVSLNALGMSAEDLGHRHQAQVLHWFHIEYNTR